jgi:hypothetical protein
VHGQAFLCFDPTMLSHSFLEHHVLTEAGFFRAVDPTRDIGFFYGNDCKKQFQLSSKQDYAGTFTIPFSEENWRT